MEEGERRWAGHRVAGEHQDVAECMFEELYALVEVRQEAEVDWARQPSGISVKTNSKRYKNKQHLGIRFLGHGHGHSRSHGHGRL